MNCHHYSRQIYSLTSAPCQLEARWIPLDQSQGPCSHLQSTQGGSLMSLASVCPAWLLFQVPPKDPSWLARVQQPRRGPHITSQLQGGPVGVLGGGRSIELARLSGAHLRQGLLTQEDGVYSLSSLDCAFRKKEKGQTIKAEIHVLIDN